MLSALVGYLFIIGCYGIVTSRNLVHLTLCLSVAQSSTYVLLLGVGFREGDAVPVVQPGEPVEPLADPLVQALALTDIVVGATVSALLLALAVQVHKTRGTVDPNELVAQHG
ncbi:MAG: cation:proton antiporter subunit C [Actinobacteria bacterium]|nr:cation:proton antiporter subunit C [Actinomycetota bacterium]